MNAISKKKGRLERMLQDSWKSKSLQALDVKGAQLLPSKSGHPRAKLNFTICS